MFAAVDASPEWFRIVHRRKKLTKICESDSGKELPKGVLDHPNTHNNDQDPLRGLEVHPLRFNKKLNTETLYFKTTKEPLQIYSAGGP